MNVRVPSFAETGIELYRETQLDTKETEERVLAKGRTNTTKHRELAIPRREFFKDKPTHPLYPPSYACIRSGYFETHNCRYYELVKQIFNHRTGEVLLTARRAEPYYKTDDFRAGALNSANSRARVLSLEKPILGQIRMGGVSRVELIKTMRPDSDAKHALDLIHRNIMALRRKKKRETNFISQLQKTKKMLGVEHVAFSTQELTQKEITGSASKIATASDHDPLVLSDFCL